MRKQVICYSFFMVMGWLAIVENDIRAEERQTLESGTSQQSGSQASAPVAASQSSSQQPRRFTSGEVLYVRNCADCHGWEGKGNGPVGQVLLKKPPSLRRPELFTQNTEAELVARILLGKDLSVPLSSEAVQETEADTTALLAYLRRLPTIPWKEVAAGQMVYDSLCVTCHGIYGRGDGLMSSALTPHPRDLTDVNYQRQVKDSELLRIIAAGKGAMPAAGDVLNPDDRRAVVAFVRLLSPGYELYDRFCEVCHGAQGVPPEIAQRELFGGANAQSKTPIFDQKYMQAHSDKQLRGWVRHMLKQHSAAMPHFAGDLNAEDVRQIIAYLRSLSS
jgi:mono/diheme cytochrome c family protein